MIIALVGPSGSGKSLLSQGIQNFYSVLRNIDKKDEILNECEKLVSEAVEELLPFPTLMKKETYIVKENVSHCNRKPREGEKNGINYWFVTDDEFEKLEMYESTNIHGNKYGTSKKGLMSTLETSDMVLVVVDQVGVRKMKEKGEKVISIFLKTDLSIMEKRMIERGDSKEDIQTRIDNAFNLNEFRFDDADYIVDNRGCFSETLKDSIKIIEKLRLQSKKETL